jgi:D-sedoheptulose 7-phosphate isomerase
MKTSTRNLVRGHLGDLINAINGLHDETDEMLQWGNRLALALRNGGKLFIAGNGGSAAHAQHLAAELVGRMHREREPLSAFALCADSSTMTALANDYGYEEVFARQVRAHAGPGDVVLLISTSGASPNVIAAAEAALEKGAEAWGLTGKLPNRLAPLCKHVIAVPSDDSQVVQEVHQVLVHLVCECVDAALPAVRNPRSPA